MYLKSIRVQGFKTFARRTELPFSRGITAIVGPNGSGKSNLVDAIRWALGERNARGLRGHRMEDVIYAGGSGGPPGADRGSRGGAPAAAGEAGGGDPARRG